MRQSSEDDGGMTQRSGENPTISERNSVTITREYNFPRATVFNMLTSRATASKFFSPEGAEKVVFEWDPRPGGAIRIDDRDGSGHSGETRGTIVELAAPELLVYRSTTSVNGTAPFDALQRVEFESLGPTKTRVVVRVTVLQPGGFPGGVESLKEGFAGGWGQTLEMLQRELH